MFRLQFLNGRHHHLEQVGSIPDDAHRRPRHGGHAAPGCEPDELDPQVGLDRVAGLGLKPGLEARLLEGDEAARHAFRVASGLDSMVLGEAQILGQLKDAVRAAEEAGALGTTLNQLFQRSFAVAKEVRSATEIGQHSISMAAAAVMFAVVGVAVRLSVDSGGTCARAAIGITGVTDKAYRAERVEQMLTGKKLDAKLIERAAAGAIAGLGAWWFVTRALA